MNLSSSSLSKSFLGAALAGLAYATPNIHAATIFTESTDFSNIAGTPTDLSSSGSAIFEDFLVDSGLAGTINSANDQTDYVKVDVSSNTLTTIPFSVIADQNGGFFNLSVLNATGNFITSVGVITANANQLYTGTLNFTTPPDVTITFYLSQEGSSSTTYNYTIGAVPEPGTATLGLAAIASMALARRRRQQS